MTNSLAVPGNKYGYTYATVSTSACGPREIPAGYTRRNRRNPLRDLWRKAEWALVEVNKIDHEHTSQQLDAIREGVEAARKLADDLAQAAAPFLQQKTAGRANGEAVE